MAGLRRIWLDPSAAPQYYPVLHTAFWIEHRLWGDSTLGYHLLNVLLHVTAACLLILILRRLKIPGAGFAGLIFVVHPVCVESVAWISEQKNTLSLVFYLLSALAYLRFSVRPESPEAGGGSLSESSARSSAVTWAYVLASVFFIFALLTKSVTATLPAALLVMLWWKRGRLSWRHDGLFLLPWFAVAFADGLFTAWVERTIIGANGAAFDLTVAQRCLLAGRVVWFYLGKLFWPTRLIFVYPHWDVKSAAAGWVGYLAAALAATAALWQLRRHSRGPLAAWLFFVGSLFPALGFFNVYPFIYSYVADHFQYLASLGVFAAVSAIVTQYLARAPAGIRIAGRGICASLIGTLVILSRAESRSYLDLTTLYETTIKRNPGCWMAHNNLGTVFLISRNLRESEAEYRTAIALKPDYPEAHYNLGNILSLTPGRLNEAVAQYQEALALEPDSAEGHNNLGNALSQMPDHLNEAIAQYEEAIRLKPDYAASHLNLGKTLLQTPGRLDEAIAQLQAALSLKPDSAETRNNLGNALSQLPGRLNEAIVQYQEALRLMPGYAEAHNDLGNALSKLPGRLNDAIAQYQEALRLKPDSPEAHFNLGNALSRVPGRKDDAVVHYEEALRLRPEVAVIHFNLALVLLQFPSRRSEATTHLETALRLQPGFNPARELLARLRSAQP